MLNFKLKLVTCYSYLSAKVGDMFNVSNSRTWCSVSNHIMQLPRFDHKFSITCHRRPVQYQLNKFVKIF